MRVAILGYDVEGKASYVYFRSRGDEITICDVKSDIEVPAGVESQLGENYLSDLDRFDLLVRTPGLHPDRILEVNPNVASKITTQTNEFLKICPTRNIIGVTGTKGKGTTSSLVYAMLKAVDKDVYIGGNIGLPPFTFLPELTAESWVVLELSSFQLCDLQLSPPVGVCLMVVPEHLNWHKDMNEYVMAKSQLFAHQGTEDIAIYLADNTISQQIAAAGKGQLVPYFAKPGAHIDKGGIYISGQEVIKTSELGLLGQHNWQNACAAVTATWCAGVQNIPAIHNVLAAFTGLEHRLEFVRELDGVKYYDDSFGTTPETAIVAIEAFEEPKVIILGGSDKGASYDELALRVARSNVRHVVLIGEQAPRIQAALDAAGYRKYSPGGTTMADIVKVARSNAQAGDVVLLSTACASFDLFKNYKDRGDQFKQAVLTS